MVLVFWLTKASLFFITVVSAFIYSITLHFHRQTFSIRTEEMRTANHILSNKNIPLIFSITKLYRTENGIPIYKLTQTCYLYSLIQYRKCKVVHFPVLSAIIIYRAIKVGAIWIDENNRRFIKGLTDLQNYQNATLWFQLRNLNTEI